VTSDHSIGCVLVVFVPINKINMLHILKSYLLDYKVLFDNATISSCLKFLK